MEQFAVVADLQAREFALVGCGGRVGGVPAHLFEDVAVF